MPYILCVYYSRTGNTEKLMKEISQELKCELVKLDDGVDRGGLGGWLRSGMQAMARRLPPVKPIRTAFPLDVYDLVIIGTPVWAGRCSAPVRSFLSQYGEQLRRTAYVVTRSSEVRYEEVFDQMDMYVRSPRVSAVTIRPNTVGSTFWRDEFLTSVRDGGKERSNNAG
ncbi:MAG: flavodoxin family protein [Oscillibacter sp.]|nr:flavodoxin family protein [Oscillibacter sp.]